MKKLLLAVLLFASTVNAQEVVDKIVAVVGDEIIMQSELEMQANYYAIQRNVDPNSEGLKDQLLKNMIDEKLLYAQAELDSIIINDEDVERQLDNQLNYFIQQYGSEDRVEEAYGMSIEKIKRELREDVRKSLMVQQVKQQRFNNINVTEREVEEFYFTYKDSIGLVPEKYDISHIFKNPVAGASLKKKIRRKAQTILDSIKNGADFAKLAEELSDDPGSAKNGGDLGSVKRGIFFPEFEAAAFQLDKNEISDVVETPVGFHIIQLLDRKGESIHTRHILFKIKPDDDADLEAIQFLNDIRDSIVRFDKDFGKMARKYSDDKETAPFGGDLGKLEIGQMQEPVLNTVKKMDEGEISYPKRIELDRGTYGYHIVLLEEHIPEHRATLENDFEELKKLAVYRKQQELYADLLKELREKVYWEIRL